MGIKLNAGEDAYATKINSKPKTKQNAINNNSGISFNADYKCDGGY